MGNVIFHSSKYLLSVLFFLYLINILISCSEGSQSSSKLPKFTNVIQEAHIGKIGGLGQTAAWGDFNGDKCEDLILSNTDRRGESLNVFLYKNNCDGTFTDVTAGSRIANMRLRSAAWADFDNDNLLDLVVGTIKGGAPPILYKNQGGGVFTDVSEKAGITKRGGTVRHVVWVDFDKDGKLDIFQANLSGSPFLYRGKKNGTFEEVSSKTGLGGKSKSNSAVFFDFNNDGFIDLFLANDGLNRFYQNNGKGAFTDNTDAVGLGGDPGWDSVAACAGDFDNDGFIDLYVVNIFSTTRVRNALYKNNNGKSFTDITDQTGTGDVGDGRTCAWVDFDGDGRLDLFTTNHLNPSKLFRNSGSSKFTDVASQAGLDKPIDVFAATWGDYNNDGFMDVFLNGHIGMALMKNSASENRVLTIRLKGDGKKTNTSAVGSRVIISSAKGSQIREVSGGRGCCEQDMLPLHFGVGGEEKIEIRVEWTSGTVCNYEDIVTKGTNNFLISEKGCNIVQS